MYISSWRCLIFFIWLAFLLDFDCIDYGLFLSFFCSIFVGFYILIHSYISVIGYWESCAFAVLYFCLIECFSHLVAEKGFNIFKLSFVFSPFRTPQKINEHCLVCLSFHFDFWGG